MLFSTSKLPSRTAYSQFQQTMINILPDIIYYSTFNITLKICFNHVAKYKRFVWEQILAFSRTYDSSVKNFTQTTFLSALKMHSDESPKCLKSFGFQTLLEQIWLNVTRTKSNLTIQCVQFFLLVCNKTPELIWGRDMVEKATDQTALGEWRTLIIAALL